MKINIVMEEEGFHKSFSWAGLKFVLKDLFQVE